MTTETNSKSWRNALPIHPAAELFPLMMPDELKALGEDIKKHGLKIPVAVWRRKGEPLQLLDGRNRLDAMELVGLKPEFVSEEKFCFFTFDKEWEFSGAAQETAVYECEADPWAFVVSANINRRHLTAEKKRDVIADLLKAQPEKSNRQIAEQIKADHKTVASVRAEKEATGEIPQLEKTIGKDGKARKSTGEKSPVAKRDGKARTTPQPKPLDEDIGPNSASEADLNGLEVKAHDDIEPDRPGEGDDGLGALLRAWGRADEHARELFCARIGLVIGIPPFMMRSTAVAS
jgi:hypothetical protein